MATVLPAAPAAPAGCPSPIAIALRRADPHRLVGTDVRSCCNIGRVPALPERAEEVSAVYVVRDQNFEGGRHELDGIRFERCRFIGADLVFRGEEPVDFSDTTFEDCRWVFVDFSDQTFVALSNLYHNAGQEGCDLVEAIFRSVREGSFVDSETMSAEHQRPLAQAVPA